MVSIYSFTKPVSRYAMRGIGARVGSYASGYSGSIPKSEKQNIGQGRRCRVSLPPVGVREIRH